MLNKLTTRVKSFLAIPFYYAVRRSLPLRRRIKPKLKLAILFALKNSYNLLSLFYYRFFYEFIDISRLNSHDLLNRIPSLQSLDQRLSYLVLQASYGDKWCILSFLAAHFQHYPDSRVLAAECDRPLVEIFIGPEVTSRKFIFIECNQLRQINSCFVPGSHLTQQVVDWSSTNAGLSITNYLLRNGLPPFTLRPLHIGCYPYFMELLHVHAVSYGVLLKTLLYLPSKVNPVSPAFYTPDHYCRAEAVLKSVSAQGDFGFAGKGVVLVNPVNFSHAALSPTQIVCIAQSILANGYRVLFNYAQSQCPDVLSSFIEGNQGVALVSVPADLLSLVCCDVDAVIGVLGGAMNVAAQFGKAHILSLHTPALYAGCDDDEYLAQFSGDRLWEWIHQDWPCLNKGRIVHNKWIGDPTSISNDQLEVGVQSFLSLIPVPDREQNVIS